MCPEVRRVRRRFTQRDERGLGLVSAIFLILVMALLVMIISRMVQTSADMFAQDLASERALLAARTGTELGLNRIYAPSGAPNCTSWSWTLDTLALPGCAADAECVATVVDGVSFYTLRVSGRCEQGGVVAERRILVRAGP